MNKEKVFTQEELDELGTTTLDLIERAIDAGDYKKAKELSKRMYKEFMMQHDFYRDWAAALFSFIGKRDGDEALHEALEECILGAGYKELLESEKKKSVRQRVENVASMLRGHGFPTGIREDKEKFVFKQTPCGSGGRLILEGRYGPPRNFLKVKEPQAMTYGRKDFPVYCCHGQLLASIPLSWGKAPWFLEIPSAKLGEEPCELWLYKDPEGIPPEAYEKGGIKKGCMPKKSC